MDTRKFERDFWINFVQTSCVLAAVQWLTVRSTSEPITTWIVLLEVFAVLGIGQWWANTISILATNRSALFAGFMHVASIAGLIVFVIVIIRGVGGTAYWISVGSVVTLSMWSVLHAERYRGVAPFMFSSDRADRKFLWERDEHAVFDGNQCYVIKIKLRDCKFLKGKLQPEDVQELVGVLKAWSAVRDRDKSIKIAENGSEVTVVNVTCI